MIKPDFSGARGSNAGDDFHELWALRQSLLLLEQNTTLTAVAVEGLGAEDESGSSPDAWDGVDCTYYFGGENASSAEKVIVEQLKYSASDPNKKWTIARLTYKVAKTKNNSVIRKLANIFFELKKNHLKLIEDGHLEVRFVSNQPVDSSVIDSFLKSQSLKKQSKNIPIEIKTLIEASGLEIDDFKLFSKSLDFSKCGSESRFATEERILITISDWTEDDARAAKNNLLDFIRRKMMLPEGRGEFITRQSILAQLGFSDPRALFPCPTAIKRVNNLVPRGITQDIIKDMLAGKKHICLHGEGGCGKTTTLQELKENLSEYSTFIIYDCYGEGRYLDSDAYRHRTKDAFLQLPNELAQNLRTPLLISPSNNLDYPRVFKKRLENASEIVASTNKNALLVIVIDAADNSVTAAKESGEKSFVHEFFNLGALPDNVRFLVTARTGRLDSLNLSPKFERVSIEGFSLPETKTVVKTIWKDAPDSWIEDFHFLSGGNPRVQSYALNYAENEISSALDYLRPNGKGLSDVFREQLEHARNKGGVNQDIKYFCAGLVALPRPIPLKHLAEILELNENHLRDICADLAPGIRLINNLISFADEDFERFIRDEAKERLPEVRNLVADYFLGKHKSDSYTATHIATALFDANRGQEIIQLINSEKEPSAIGDPVLRRETQLQRLKIAMKVCKETGNTTDAILTLLAGAGALKTGSAIQEMLINNPDLSANFARDTFGRVILRDSIQIENHGVLLFHLMAFDARKNNGILVREGHRQLRAWLQRRNDAFEEQKKEHPNSHPQGWEISFNDIAAETEAILRTSGYQDAKSLLLRWKPKHIGLKVVSILLHNLMAFGDESLLDECLDDETIKIPWKLFLLTPLAFTKKQIDITHLEASLEKLARLKFINLSKVRESYREDDVYTEVLETIMTACEIVISRGGNKDVVIPILEKLSASEFRLANRLHKSKTALIDLTLRAFTLLENLMGRECVLKTYLIDKDSSPADEAKENKPRNPDREKLETFIGRFIGLYNTRAKIISGQISPQSCQEAISKIATPHGQEDYRLYNDFDIPKMRRLAALSLTRLMFIPDLNRESLLKSACSLINTNPFNSAETEIFQRFIIDKSLQQQILNEVGIRVKKIKETRTSADEKIEALVRFARLILPISYYDAESIFNEAISVAGEVNSDSIHEIALFAPLSKSAIRTMQIEKSREVAEKFAIVSSDLGIRLDGYDNFPWGKIAQTLTNLDISVALAALGRWEDDNLVDRSYLLPKLLETSLSNKTLSPIQIISLFPLLDYVDEELINKIVNEISKDKNNLELNCLVEEIAREELLRLGNGKREKVYEELNSLNQDNKKGFWFDHLFQATAFHKAQSKENPENNNSSNSVSNYEAVRENLLNSFDWGKYKFVSPEEINAVVKEIFDSAKSSDTYIGTYQILEKIRDFISIGSRVLYLKALSLSESKHISDYEIAREITILTKLWEESPSVQNWNRQYVLQLIIDKLPSFTMYLSYGDYPPPELPTLLTRSKASDKEICEALLEATQRHVDSLNAPTVYALVGLITQYCQPDEAVGVIEFYSNQLLQQISIEDREEWDLSDIPKKPSEGFARYLYSLMGDIDVRNRWRAAHSLRILARLNDTSIIDEIVQLYDRKIEKNYRKTDAPFYWIASRLWFVIALTRIADESPASVKHLTQWLLEIASDEDFPHVILRAFAKSAISTLLKNKEISLSSEQIKTLEQINVSPFPKKKPKKIGDTHFDKYNYKENEKRRFHFDSMDTLPYWYKGKARMFERVDFEEFINIAEQWIVDKWGVKDNPWEWNREPRKNRLSGGYLERTSGHGHGSLPIADRFHTYLEWHAMWCSVGSLLQIAPLIKPEYDDDGFEERLKSNGLSLPPYWLVDFRNPKPLAKRFWFAPQKDIDAWLEDVKDNDFLIELQISDKSEHIIVGSDYDTRSSEFTLSVNIDTALVSPETASSLLKALQTVNNPWDYRIPPFGDELKIDSSPYKLIGWLSSDYSESGLDERDPFKNEISSIWCVPSDDVLSSLNIEFSFENESKWIEVVSKKEIFNYKSWSDMRWDDYEERRYSSSSVRSNGWQLSIDKNALKSYLNQKSLDLIVEVRIVRKNRDYGYSEYNTKETKEAEFERLFILRRDGIIEAAERCFGTW